MDTNEWIDSNFQCSHSTYYTPSTYSVKELSTVSILEEEVVGASHGTLPKESDHVFTAKHLHDANLHVHVCKTNIKNVTIRVCASRGLLILWLPIKMHDIWTNLHQNKQQLTWPSYNCPHKNCQILRYKCCINWLFLSRCQKQQASNVYLLLIAVQGSWTLQHIML